MAKEKNNKNDNKNFMKDFRAELKKVVWPTSKQMVNNVGAVIAIVLITAIVVFCLDFVFAGLNEFGINKLKENIILKNQSQVIDYDAISAPTDNSENNDQNNNVEDAQENNNDNNSDADINNDTNTQNVEKNETTAE